MDVETKTIAAHVLVNNEGRIQHWDKDAEQLFGYNVGEVLGWLVDFFVPLIYRERHRLGLAAAMSRRYVNPPQSIGNIPVICSDGVIRLFPFRQIVVCDGLGRAVGALVIFSPSIAPDESNGLQNVFVDALM